MKISVITINRNNLSGLKRTLESVFAQTYPEMEYIVIDGASTDGSRELIEQNASRLAYWISEPDGGIYSAMNKGVRAATSDYAIFINSGDTLYAPDVLERAARQLAGGKDFYIGHQYDEGKTNLRYFSPRQLDARLLALTALPHQATFIRLELLRKRPYDESYRILADREQMFYELVMKDASYELLDFLVAHFEGGGISHNAAFSQAYKAEEERLITQHLSQRIATALRGRSKYETKMLYALAKDPSLSRNWKLLRNTIKLIFQDSFKRSRK